MVNFKMSQQQSQAESTAECTGTSSAQSAPPRIDDTEISSAIRGQRRGHIKGVGRVLRTSNKEAGSSSSAAAASGSRFMGSQSTTAPSFTAEQMQTMFDTYQQHLQATLSTVLPGFQLPPVPQLVPSQRPSQPNQENASGDESQEDDGESPPLGD